MLVTISYVGLFGLVGVLIRYYIYTLFISASLTLPSLIVNGLGCLCVGVVVAISEKIGLSEALKYGLIIGLCGGLTTFSTIIFDIIKLLNQQEFTQAIIYFFFTNILGIACFGFGFIITSYVIK